MARRRMTLMCFLVLMGVLAGAGEALAESTIAYICQAPASHPLAGTRQFCLVDPDVGTSVVITEFDFLGSPDSFTMSPSRTEILLNASSADAFGGETLCPPEETGCLVRVPLDGSPPSLIPTTATVRGYASVSWFNPPPSVATLSPTNQTIAVFLLGMIASALIMRGKERTVEQT